MANVENRIVRMEFDNAEFEKRVRNSLKTLAELEKSLEFKGAKKGFSALGSAASGLFSRLTKGGADVDKSLQLKGAQKGLTDTGNVATGLFSRLTRGGAEVDRALQLKGAQKGLADVNQAAGRVNLAPVAAGAQTVSAGFIAMSTVAVTALATITSAAVRAGGSIATSLNVQPVLEGFREYEMNIGSIQTILANTRRDGTNLQQVNAALDELNRYSDQTIYNFAQMTKNIGTFTAAGVDMGTAVQSIKGISNLAAISGSSAEQASTAMYQLSQAIAANKVGLVDWNSVVNAGMGGEIFQRSLFETGKALKTIEGVSMDTTFDEWTAAGNSFRDSLQEGWITGEVLTTTLKGFTGEMTEAQLLAIGYTKEQAAEILELGQSGVEAATKIRTLTQLMSTVKETITSGWSQSFRTVFGDFEEATELFTGINNAVTGFVERQAEARNSMLDIWKNLGGRDTLINGLIMGFSALGDILGVIKESFRDIFPKTTAGQLLGMTRSFAEFMERLKPSEATLERLKSIFTGFFAALDLGWETIKAGAGFLKDLFIQITGFGDGGLLKGLASVGDMFTALRDGVDGGQKIRDFFDNLLESLEGPIEKIRELRENIGEFFGTVGSAAGDAVGEVGSWYEPFKEFGQGVLDTLDEVGDAISEWFRGLWEKIAEALAPGEANLVLEAFNTSILGGIALLIGKWLKGGINFDFTDGFLDNASGALEQLTDTLAELQTNLKADSLMKIAQAIAILTAALVVMSLLDAAALSRAMGAIAVGLGQLMGAFAIMSGLGTGFVDGVIFTTIATGMVVMAGAIVVLSAAVAILGNMDWPALLRGLGATIVLLAGLTAAAVVISKNVVSLFTASLGLAAMGGALVILAGAVAIFGNMDWQTLVKGMGALAGVLVVVVGAAVILSKHVGKLVGASIGLVAMGIALNVLAKAVEAFGEMDTGELVKGLVTITLVLGGLVAAAVLMSKHVAGILLSSVALVALSYSLTIIVDVLKDLGDMSWGELIKGLLGMAAALTVLVVAAYAAGGSISGAIAITVLSGAMILMAKALKTIGEMKLLDIIKGLVGLGLALAIIGTAATVLAPITPALLGLGAALLLIGAAFAAFGYGANAAVEAFIKFGEESESASKGITEWAKAIGKALPLIFVGLAEGIIDFVETILGAAPVIIEGFGKIIGAVIDALKKLLPKVGDFAIELIETLLRVITESAPDVIIVGLLIVDLLLQGIRDNIGQFTSVAIQIVINFLTAIEAQIDPLVAAGLSLLVAFISGITNNIGQVVMAVAILIITFIAAVGNMASSIVAAGANAIVNFVNGMTSNASKIITAITTLITTLITTVSNNAQRIVAAGANAIINFVTGLGHHAGRIVTAGVTTIIRFIQGVGSNAVRLAEAAADVIIDFLNGLASVIREKSGELRQAGVNIAVAIADGFTGGLASKAAGMAESAVNAAKGAWNSAKDFLGISSPSRLFMEMGQYVAEGFAIGLDGDDSAEASSAGLARRTVEAFRETISSVASQLELDPDFNPTITPVLDLTRVREDAGLINDMMGDGTLAPVTSINQARSIASTAVPVEDSSAASAAGGDVNFNQTINAPKQLSTADIYRQTRNQIAVAKEELNVA